MGKLLPRTISCQNGKIDYLYSMSIYGAGSDWWDGQDKATDFFQNNNYEIGWSKNEAQDIYQMVQYVKLGDFIYLKANRPGSLHLRIKGIGIVTGFQGGSIIILNVKWIITEKFHIDIPQGTGKHTHIRSATFYEEFNPYVIEFIIRKLFS